MLDLALTSPNEGDDWLAITESALPVEIAVKWAERVDCGGMVSFLGIVRDTSEGRTGVTAIDYEAYHEPALQRLGELTTAVRSQIDGLGRIVVFHRVGRVLLGEPSVLVAVSAVHRAECFAACRFLIDELKATLPIWKYEHWGDAGSGEGWSPSARPVQVIGEAAGR